MKISILLTDEKYLMMESKAKPEDFRGCKISDTFFLDDEGFFLRDEHTKIFDQYLIIYMYSKHFEEVSFNIFLKGNGRPSAIGYIRYFQKWDPNYRFQTNLSFETRSKFLEKALTFDRDIALWLLWNV